MPGKESDNTVCHATKRKYQAVLITHGGRRRLAICSLCCIKNWGERGPSERRLHHLHQSVPNHMLKGEKSFKLAQVEVYVQLKAGQKQH